MNNLNIVTVLSVDPDKSLAEINRMIKVIQEKSSLQTLKVKIELAEDKEQTKSFAEKFKEKFTSIFKTLAGSEPLEAAFLFLKAGITYVNDLNKSLTQLSMVFNESQRDVQKYGDRIQSLGQKMSVSSTDVAKVAVEYARQGLSQQEMFKQTENAIRFAKISNLDYAASTKILSTAVAAMNVDMVRASDVLTYLGDASSSSAGEISEAMQIIGGSAGDIGINFEKVGSWVTAVSSKTKDSASSIGNSVKTILSRMQSLKKTGYDKEDNTQLYQVTKALADVNVKLTDNKGNFRNFGDVMDELGGKWEGLTAKQKSYVAATVAGTSQQAGFISLMESYGDSLQYYKGALNSAGITQRQFSQWQEGSEAAVNRFKVALEGLWQNSFQSESIVTFMNVMALGINILSSFVDLVGPIPLLLGGFSAAVLMLNSSFRTAAVQGTFFTGVLGSMSAALDIAKVAIRSFAASTLIGIGVAALSVVVEKLISGLFSLSEETKNFSDEYNKSANAIDSNISSLSGLSAEYDKLSSKAELTAAEKERLHKIETDLVNVYGVSATGIDAQGVAYSNSTTLIKERIEELKRQKEAEAQILRNQVEGNGNSIRKNVKESIKKKDTAAEKISEYQTYIKNTEEQIVSKSSSGNFSSREIENLKENLKYYKSHLAYWMESSENASQELKKNSADVFQALSNQINDSGGTLTDESRQVAAQVAKALSFSDIDPSESFKSMDNVIAQMSSTGGLDSLIKRYKELKDQLKDDPNNTKLKADLEATSKSINDSIGQLTSLNGVSKEGTTVLADFKTNFAKTFSSMAQNGAVLDRQGSGFKDLSELTKKAKEELGPLNQLISDVKDKQVYSADAIAELIIKYPELSGHIIKTANGYTIEMDALEALRKKKAEKAISDLEQEKKSSAAALHNSLLRLQAYGIEASGIQSIEDAKKKKAELIETKQKFNTPSKGIWGAIKQGYVDAVVNPKFDGAINAYESYITINEQIEALKKLINSPSFGVSGKNKSSGSSSASSPAKQEEALKDALEEKDRTKELITTFNQEHEARKRVNDQIERKIKLHEQNKNYNDAIAETTRLYESQKKSLEELNAANDKMRGQADTVRTEGARFNKSSLSNQDYFDTWFDPNNEGTKSFSDVMESYEVRSQQVHDAKGRSNESKNKELEQIKQEQDEVQRLFDKLQMLKNAYNANGDKINEMTEALNNSYDSLLRLRKDGLSYSLGHLDSSIEKIKNSMGTHLETGENYRRDLSNELLLANEKKLKIDAELKNSRDNINSGKLTPEQIQKEKDLIQENEKLAMNISNEISEAAYKRAQSTVKEAALEVQKYSDMLDVSKKRMEALEEGTADYSKEMINQGTIIQSKIAAEKQVQLTLEEQMKTAGLTEVQWEDFNKQLQTSIKNQLDLEIALNSTSQGLKAQAGKLADEVISFYKEMYGKQKEVALDGIEKESKALEKAHKEKMSMLDEEMRKHEDLINAQLKAIDDKASLDDYNKQLGKLTSEKNALINEIKKRALNTTVEGKAKVAELEKQLADKTAEIEDLTTNRDREQQKKSLQEQLDNKKKYIDEETQLENKKFEEEKDKLDDRKEAEEKRYEEQINNEKKFAQIRSDILKGNIAEATKELNAFSAFINGNMTTIGVNISDNLLSKITQFSTDLQTTSETMASTFMQTSASIENNLIKQLDVLIGKLKEVEKLSYKPTISSPLSVDEILKNMQSNSEAYNKTTDASKKEGYHQANQVYMEELRRRGINIQYNPATGTYVTPGGVDLYNYRNPFNMPDKIFDKYLKNKEIYENPQSSDRQRFDAAKENADLREEYKIKSDDYTHAELEAAARFDTGGMTPSFGTGPKVALLDQKEIVLAQSDTSNLLKVVDLTRSIIDGVKSFDFGRLNPFALATASNTNTSIQKVEITIPADVKEPGAGKRFALDFINGLEARGVRIQT